MAYVTLHQWTNPDCSCPTCWAYRAREAHRAAVAVGDTVEVGLSRFRVTFVTPDEAEAERTGSPARDERVSFSRAFLTEAGPRRWRAASYTILI